MHRLRAAMMCKPERQALLMTGEGPATLAVVKPLGVLWSSPSSAPRYLAPSSRVMCYSTSPARLHLTLGMALATATCFSYMGWAWHRSSRTGVSQEVKKMFNRGGGEQLYKEKQAACPDIQIKRNSDLGLLRWELDKPGQLMMVGHQREEEDTTRVIMTHLKALEGRTNVAYLGSAKPVWTQIVGNHLPTTFTPSQEDLAQGFRDAVLEVGQCGPPPLIVIDGAQADVVLQELNGTGGNTSALASELVQLQKEGHLSIVLFSA